MVWRLAGVITVVHARCRRGGRRPVGCSFWGTFGALGIGVGVGSRAVWSAAGCEVWRGPFRFWGAVARPSMAFPNRHRARGLARGVGREESLGWRGSGAVGEVETRRGEGRSQVPLPAGQAPPMHPPSRVGDIDVCCWAPLVRWRVGLGRSLSGGLLRGPGKSAAVMPCAGARSCGDSVHSRFAEEGLLVRPFGHAHGAAAPEAILWTTCGARAVAYTEMLGSQSAR